METVGRRKRRRFCLYYIFKKSAISKPYKNPSVGKFYKKSTFFVICITN